MADAILYKHSSAEFDYSFDFVDEVASSDTLKTVGTGDTETLAVSSDGTDVASTIHGTPTFSGTVLTVRISSLTNGEDYTITFVAEETTGTERFFKVLELRVRDDIGGGF